MERYTYTGDFVAHPHDHRRQMRVIVRSDAPDNLLVLRRSVITSDAIRGYAINRSLKHPNIIPVLDGFVDSTQRRIWCTVYPKYHQDPPNNLTFQHLLELLNALAYLEAMHLQHNDIKPDNIVWTGADAHAHPVIIDFGLTDSPDYPIYLDRYAPAYRAPEIWAGADGPGRAGGDVWAVGIMFYFWLTGKMYYSSSTIRKIQADLTNAEAITAARHATALERVPKEWSLIIGMLLAPIATRPTATKILGVDQIPIVIPVKYELTEDGLRVERHLHHLAEVHGCADVDDVQLAYNALRLLPPEAQAIPNLAIVLGYLHFDVVESYTITQKIIAYENIPILMQWYHQPYGFRAWFKNEPPGIQEPKLA